MDFKLKALLLAVQVAVIGFWSVQAGDNNNVFSPCQDTTVQKGDGFTFGLAFAPNESFYSTTSRLSPCDKSFVAGSKIALFRPKVDEITLMTINSTDLSPVCC